MSGVYLNKVRGSRYPEGVQGRESPGSPGKYDGELYQSQAVLQQGKNYYEGGYPRLVNKANLNFDLASFQAGPMRERVSASWSLWNPKR